MILGDRACCLVWWRDADERPMLPYLSLAIWVPIVAGVLVLARATATATRRRRAGWRWSAPSPASR